MIKPYLTSLFLTILIFCTGCLSNPVDLSAISHNANKESEKDTLVKKLYENISEGIDALHKENLKDYMATIHDLSPSYIPVRKTMPRVFHKNDLEYEIIKYSLLGVDADYAYMRLVHKIKKIDNSAFRNHKIDAVHIFKEKDGKWLIWGTNILTIEYID